MERDLKLVSDVGEYLIEFVSELLERLISLNGEPVVFDFFPEQLDQVEFGTVGWQKPKVEITLLPFGNHRLEQGAGVDRGIIDDDRGRPCELATERVDASDRDSRVNTTFDDIGMEGFATVIEETQDIDLLALAAGDLDALADWLPAIRNTGRQRETRLVEIEQVVLAFGDFTLKFVQFLFVAQIFFGLACCEAISASVSRSSLSFSPIASRCRTKFVCPFLL